MSAKIKLSQSSSASVSPVKGSKCRSFLASVLTPSQTKRWIRRKKSNKSQESFEVTKVDAKNMKDFQASDDFSEPGYSSIQDLQLTPYPPKSGRDSTSILSAKNSEHDFEPSIKNLNCDRPILSQSSHSEPVYATIHKKRGTNLDSQDAGNRNLVEEQKEEIRLLVERLRELTAENRELHRNIESVIREDKWKEDSLHAELKLKISQLEADTHKEVTCLSEQIKTLLKERKVLANQVQILHEEKRTLQGKHDDVCMRMNQMVSPEFLKKKIDENQKLVNQVQKKHQEEIIKLQQENEIVLESKISLTSDVENFKEKLKLLVVQNETLRKSDQELMVEKNRMQLQLEESKQMEQEAQKMLILLLKMTESIAMERDILLNKASFQDHQQNLLKTSIMDYSLNMGRLQEHISNLSKEKTEELQKLKTGESQRDQSLKSFYGKELDILRSKVLNQSNTINDLKTEKSQLEIQMESLWQAACVSKSKPNLLEDLKYNL